MFSFDHKGCNELDLCHHTHSTFSQTHKIDKIGNIAFCIAIHSSLFVPYDAFINVKLDINGCHCSAFEGCKLHWSISFPMAQPKQNWQYWHSCIVESL